MCIDAQLWFLSACCIISNKTGKMSTQKNIFALSGLFPRPVMIKDKDFTFRVCHLKESVTEAEKSVSVGHIAVTVPKFKAP